MGLLEVAHDAIPRIGPPVLRLHQQGDQGQARRARKRPFAVMPGRLSAATVRFVPPMRSCLRQVALISSATHRTTARWRCTTSRACITSTWAMSARSMCLGRPGDASPNGGW